jgi:hypothetical protein
MDNLANVMRKGSCHCGQTTFTVETGEIADVKECNCSHCQRKGHLLWFVPRHALHIQSGESELSTYTFNKHVIQHKFCPKCGCAPFAVGMHPSGSEMAAVNVRCLEDIDIGSLKRTMVNGKAK